MIRWASLGVMCAACGRIGFDATRDSGPPNPFGAPVHLAELGSPAADDDPTLTPDLLEIYFGSTRAGGAGMEDIWYSRRNDLASPWAPPTLVTGLSTPRHETGPELSVDTLQLLLSSDRPGGAGADDLYSSTRATRQDTFAVPQRIAELASGTNDVTPTMTEDRRLMVFASQRAGTLDLFVATRPTELDPWSAPWAIAELDSAAEEASPWLAPDGLAMYFNSTRDGEPAIYVTRRASTSLPWEPPAKVIELDDVGGESDPWLTPDLRTIVFTSDRTGDPELYMATR